MLRQLRSLNRQLGWAIVALALALSGTVIAQSAATLERLAPSETILALGLTPDALPDGDLADAFATLDVDGAKTALENLRAVFDEVSDAPSGLGGGELGFMFGELLEMTSELDASELSEELDAVCPPLNDDLDALTGVGDWANDLLLSVQWDPFSPMPGVLALAQVEPEALSAADALYATLLDCFAGETLGNEGGTDLYVLGDGSDVPLVVAARDGLFLIGSQPALVRGALRRAGGAEEPSLADHPSVTDAKAGAGARIYYDLAAIADVVEALAPVPPDDEAMTAALNRGLAVLRTVGAGGAHLALDDEGVALSFSAHPDPDGGDAVLYDLLTCSECRSGDPSVVPEGAVGATGSSIRLGAWMTWLDGLIADLSGAAMGAPVTLRELLVEEVGVDLDALLFDWIGEEVVSVKLGALSTDLADLIRQPASALVLEVRSAEAAEAGLVAIEESIDELAAMLSDVPGDGAEMLAFFDQLAVRTVEAGGLSYRRVQIGPTTDLAVAISGNRLIIASPPSSLSPVLAVVRGDAPDDVGSDGWAQVEAASTADRTAWSYRDGGADLRGVADLLDLVAQPTAALMALGARAGLEEARSADATDEGFGSAFGEEPQPLHELDDDVAYPGPEGLLEVMPQELTAGVPVDAELGPDTPSFGFDSIDVWSLPAIPAGTEVSVVMTSSPLDTYLYLYDAETGAVLAENDDAPWTDRSEIRFLADGRPLLVGATSWGGGGEGAYQLELTIEGGEVAEPEPEPEPEPEVEEPAIEAPTFAELLPLTEIVPEAVRIVADRIGLSWSVSTVEDGVIRTDQRLTFDW